MTRRGKLQPRDQLDLAGAFRFLGEAPRFQGLALVVDLLRESGVQEVIYDDELVELAKANGCSGFDALDLATAFAHGVESLYAGPQWSRRTRIDSR